jgi:parallel beta-helix repeat protein
MWSRMIRLAAAAVAALFLVVPSVAAALPFTVNSTGDGIDALPGDGVCKVAAANKCTFRAAAEEANAHTGADDIGFDAAVTNQNIAINSPIQFSTPATVNGCSSQASPTKPCVGVVVAPGTPSINVFNVLTADMTVEGLALGGGSQAIFYGSGQTGLVMRNNWIGMNIGGSARPNGVGITLTGGQATIGGSTPADRNVIASNGQGIAIFGGSNNTIQGNYLGTAADGKGARPNGASVDIEATGVSAVPTGNLIGGLLDASAASTSACDGVCNVIVGDNSGTAIELARPFASGPAGPTTIQGNYIGTDVTGTTLPTTAPVLINAGTAGPVTIGGPAANARNLIDGGNVGVRGGTNSLTILGNYIGVRSDGAAALPAVQTGLDLISAVPNRTIVKGNRFGGNGSAPLNGLVMTGSGGRVTGNVFGVGTGGQNLRFGSAPVVLQGLSHIVGGATAAESNVIGGGGPGGTPAGVLLDGADTTTVKGNFIGADPGGAARANGGPGVLLQNTALNDIVGGDAAGEQNTISNSGDSAIVVKDAASKGDQFRMNIGHGNAALFIDLGDDGAGNTPTGPNAGIQAPVVATASPTVATGTSKPGATVRLFVASASAAGTIKRFVGQTTANSSGQWGLTYPSALTVGDRVAATQTNSAHNTSELSALRAVAL